MSPDKEKTPAGGTGASPEKSDNQTDKPSLKHLAENRPPMLVAFDWRAAARATEQANQLEPIDHALTATGLAAEVGQLAGRIGRLT